MESSVLGLIAGILYVLLFEATGFSLSAVLFRKTESFAVHLLLGNTLSIVMLCTMPVIFAFFFGFTLISHILAGSFALLLTVFSMIYLLKNKYSISSISSVKRHKFLFFICAVFLFFCFLVLHGFTYKNGAVYSSQATYGDMSMHLSFITSIATKGSFPPDYSILPGTRLAYPFFSDSISSSLYLLGMPLKAAYCIPMFLAAASVFAGLYAFAYRWLKDKLKAAAVFILFFFNGGFGFIYFLEEGGVNRILNSFYETPTNLVDNNIRWVNVIVDMMFPQRATLFGWSVLFPLIYLLYRAVFEDKKRYFPVVGVLCAALPMIHTHSLLFAAILCVVWMIIWLFKQLKFTTGNGFSFCIKTLIILCLVGMEIGGWVFRGLQLERSDYMLYIGIAVILLCVLLLLVLIVVCIKRKGVWGIFTTWGVLLIIVLVFALPQMLFWTFSQTNDGGFIEGYFNWANNTKESYLLFYLKNLGLTGILFIPAIIFAKKESLFKFMPAVLAWTLAEFIRFQPNEYDNNKLLYPAFIFICIMTADFAIDMLRKINQRPVKIFVGSLVFVVCTISAGLTMAREIVSEYEIFGKAALDACSFIEESEKDVTVLTGTRHNNEIAALTGRDIVCGSPSYLYFHGLDYRNSELAVRQMYENPEVAEDLFERYSVDYIMVSSFEKGDYAVNETAIAKMFTCVYNKDGIKFYKVG